MGLRVGRWRDFGWFDLVSSTGDLFEFVYGASDIGIGLPRGERGCNLGEVLPSAS